MINILIVEDDLNIAKGLKNLLSQIRENMNIHCVTKSAEALAYAKEQPIDIFCLDIQLDDYNGIELAKQIRGIYGYVMTPIVFITAVPTRELIAFKEIHCYDYIVKPFTNAEVEKVFSTLINHGVFPKEKVNKPVLKFREKDCFYVVPQEDILYLESNFRRVKVVTVNESFTDAFDSLKRISDDLTEDFIKCHKSFYVNQQHIRGVNFKQQIILLKNSDVTLPLGRSFHENLKGVGYEND